MVLLGGVYNVLLWGIGRTAFPSQTDGSLIRRADGTIVGSRLIAQKFARPEYFQPRPSGVDYNAASTGGTNYGPSNPDHLKARPGTPRHDHEAGRCAAAGGAIRDGDRKRRRHGSAHTTGSGGAAGARVAAARGVPVERVRELIEAHTEPPTFGFLGRARVNVLELNLALDGTIGPLAPEASASSIQDTSMSERARTISIWDPGIVRQAVVDSLWKLDPRIQIKNPVMFIVEIGSVLTTMVFIQELTGGGGQAAVHRPGGVLVMVHRPVRKLR